MSPYSLRVCALLAVWLAVGVSLSAACSGGDGGEGGNGEGGNGEGGEGGGDEGPTELTLEDYPDYEWQKESPGHRLCADDKVRAAVEAIMKAHPDNPAHAAEDIQKRAQRTFKKKFNAFVSECPFGFVTWHSGPICHYKTEGGLYVLVYMD